MPKHTSSRSRIFLTSLLFIFFVSADAGASSLKVCYEASLLFKVGESCIQYTIDGEQLKIESSQHTTGLIDMAHHLEQRVTADISMSPFESVYLFFYEKNNRKSMTHHYFYKDQLVYAGNSFKYKSKKYKSVKKKYARDGIFDPAAAVLYIQLNSGVKPMGELRTFFEGKYIDISYKYAGSENVRFDGEDHKCAVMDFTIPVATSSLITPTGTWKVYIDEETGVIMLLELVFPLGTAKLKPVSITGDTAIFSKYMRKLL